MGLLIGALVAALGTVAAGLVLRGRARHRPSLHPAPRQAAFGGLLPAIPASSGAQSHGTGSPPPPVVIQGPAMPALSAFQLPPGAAGPGPVPVPEPEGPGWSIVEESDDGRSGGRDTEVHNIDNPGPDRGWSVQPHTRHASEAEIGKPRPHRWRGAKTLFGIVTYAALAAALVAVLLGMLIMLATTR